MKRLLGLPDFETLTEMSYVSVNGVGNEKLGSEHVLPFVSHSASGGVGRAHRWGTYLAVYNLQADGIHSGTADPQEDAILRGGSELQRDV